MIFGNRRLKALMDYKAESKKDVTMCCIVHDLAQGDIPVALIGKLLCSMTTSVQNGGRFVSWQGQGQARTPGRW